MSRGSWTATPRSWTFALAALLVAASLPLVASPADVRAAGGTYVVNATDDTDDGSCDAGHCSLREAMNAVNADGSGTINFAISGVGQHVIAPLSSLPTIRSAMTIDGYTQSGSSPNTLAVGNDAALMIVIDGSAVVNHTDSSSAFQLPTASATGTTIRGLVIGNFVGSGIHAAYGQGFENALGGLIIEGNFIGTDATGMLARPNGAGVCVGGNAYDFVVGGSAPADRNVISGNLGAGVSTDCSAFGNAPHDGRVENNYIGTDVSGVAALGNGRSGIELAGSAARISTVGNVVAANGTGLNWNGITVAGSNNVLHGNLIGVGADGTTALGHPGSGVEISGSGNVIGGPAAGNGNVVANSGEQGILVAGQNNQISGNSIHASVGCTGCNPVNGLGIDLNGDGVTANDPGDADSGPNLRQNYPVLTDAQSLAGRISGALDSAPDTTFRVELFSNSVVDGSGYGEGERFLGAIDVTTDGVGAVAFDAIVSQSFDAGEWITATATDPNGNTSEFSAAIAAVPGDPPATPSPDTSATPDPSPAAPTGGSVAGTVAAEAASAGPCLIVGAASIDFGDNPLHDPASGPSTQPIPGRVDGTQQTAFTLQSCAETDQQIVSRATDATSRSSAATWSLQALGDPCAANGPGTTNVYGILDVGEGDLPGATSLGVLDTPVADLVPDALRSTELYVQMPCQGSDGTGETFDLSIYYTAVVP